MPAKKLRLVTVTVIPQFMLDDGETLTPLSHRAVTIPAAEWPSYSGERFPAEVQAWQDRLDTEGTG